uniref:G-protein coupled receptors family 3 profile domain-containing protein n=1 Tax=Glossina austeni TaxID=7395 RepID=A0A1A9VV31_GLOAU
MSFGTQSLMNAYACLLLMTTFAGHGFAITISDQQFIPTKFAVVGDIKTANKAESPNFDTEIYSIGNFSSDSEEMTQQLSQQNLEEKIKTKQTCHQYREQIELTPLHEQHECHQQQRKYLQKQTKSNKHRKWPRRHHHPNPHPRHHHHHHHHRHHRNKVKRKQMKEQLTFPSIPHTSATRSHLKSFANQLKLPSPELMNYQNDEQLMLKNSHLRKKYQNLKQTTDYDFTDNFNSLSKPHNHNHHQHHQHHSALMKTAKNNYFTLTSRSGRHRGRASHTHSNKSNKIFRSLPDNSEHNFEEQHFNQKHLVSSTIVGQRHWPVKREAVVEGDVILGGLMMVHSREDTIMCGPIMPQGGIQALEAMLYTIDCINKVQLLPNITLGAHILDDCDKDSYGLEMAVDFIKGSISNIDDAEYHCNKTQVRKVISGVVGAASSVTSIQVANLLRLFRIPQVSFFSTSPELSNKQRFEYFSRTIPSDHYQVKAMVEIVKRLGWSYVSIIYEESNYGIKAFEELEELLARHSVCIAVKEKLVKDSGVAEEIAYDNIVQKLLTKPRARGAIIFGSDQEVREVMRAVRRNNATGSFSWIGSDGWSARNLVSDGNEPEVEGTLSVQPQANPVRGFEEYFLNLTVENNQRNPWFVEFWEDRFQCRYPGSSSTPYNNYNRTCTTEERLSRENTDFEDQLQFVSDAVMAFAYALRDMHRDLCGGRPSLCEAMKPTKGGDLLKYLRKVQFEGLSGDHFRFDNNGDGPARYNIIHFKQSIEGQYHWVKVGEYYEGELRLNMSAVQFKLLHPKPPESVCSLPCDRGQAKKYVEGESCCWHCFNCSTYQIRHPLDETQCLTCQLGTLPDIAKQKCQTIPEVYLRPESAWAIGAMAFSSTGILITLFVIGVFVSSNWMRTQKMLENVFLFFVVFVRLKCGRMILINGVWMVIAPSHAMYHHPTREDNLLVCDSYIDASYMIAFFYPIVLIVICTVYAVLTRKIPEAFNESKHIGFTMYTTCVIWLAFVPLYFGTANHVPLRITSMSVTISLSASVTIACLFSPKLYIILIRPDRNVRQSMMPPRYSNVQRTGGTGQTSIMAPAVVTAATCAQNENIQKHITPGQTEHSIKAKKLCEMATQTIAIGSSILTNLDSQTYQQIPYADDPYVPNNNRADEKFKQQTDKVNDSVGLYSESNAGITVVASGCITTSQTMLENNNKINQQTQDQQSNTVTNNGINMVMTTPSGNYLSVDILQFSLLSTSAPPLSTERKSNASSCINQDHLVNNKQPALVEQNTTTINNNNHHNNSFCDNNVNDSSNSSSILTNETITKNSLNRESNPVKKSQRCAIPV